MCLTLTRWRDIRMHVPFTWIIRFLYMLVDMRLVCSANHRKDIENSTLTKKKSLDTPVNTFGKTHRNTQGIILGSLSLMFSTSVCVCVCHGEEKVHTCGKKRKRTHVKEYNHTFTIMRSILFLEYIFDILYIWRNKNIVQAKKILYTYRVHVMIFAQYRKKSICQENFSKNCTRILIMVISTTTTKMVTVPCSFI